MIVDSIIIVRFQSISSETSNDKQFEKHVQQNESETHDEMQFELHVIFFGW